VTATAGGSLTGTWSSLGTVTTIDINGGTADAVVIGGASAAAITGTTITAAAGSAAAPSHTFTGNTTTGLFAASSELGLAAGGAEIARVTASALNVGSTTQIVITSGSDVGFSAGIDGHCAILTSNDSGLGMRRLGGAGGVIQTYVDGAGNACGNITTSAGATAYNTTSDGTLKTNLRPIKSGEIVDGLEAWKFDWINADKAGHGVIAQEAEKVFPHAVSVDDSGLYGIDYSKFVPVLLAEIKALRARVAALEAH
jgi:hypothetical protein